MGIGGLGASIQLNWASSNGTEGHLGTRERNRVQNVLLLLIFKGEVG
jgi:hypothetical protein